VSLSTDGGVTFTVKYTFPPQLSFIRVAVAPSDPKIIYVTGFNGTKAPLVIGVSTDGGASWTVDENASMGVASSNQIVDFLGVAPDDPHTVYVMVTSGKGDEIWKSSQSGKGLVKVLTLADQEEWPRGGFAFAETGKTVYVAGFDPLNTGMQPPASLYISHDAGQTWQRRISPGTGPRYRCLGYRGGKLYACGGEQLSGDKFFLGSSTDEGVTWSSIVKLTDVTGPNQCVAQRCSMTVDFLLPFYGSDGGAPARPDGGAPIPDAAPAPLPEPPGPKLSKGGGCSFVPDGESGAAVALLALALVGMVRQRRA
jgi:MYXO-CTERM domain-containing protein